MARFPFKDKNGYLWQERTAYVAEHELKDGRTFRLEYVQLSNEATWDDPPESNDPQDIYKIEDVEVDYKDLPEELQEFGVLDGIRAKANPDYNYDFGDDDGS